MTNPASGSVVGNSLVSFMSGMTPAMRENVQLALLFAEKATTDVIREGSTIDPYTHYRNQLKYLGWDIQLPLERDDRAARRTVVESALAAIDVAGPGFRDFTRIAASDPHVWRDILLSNREELIAQSRHFLRALHGLEAAIKSGDTDALETLIDQASAARANWRMTAIKPQG